MKENKLPSLPTVKATSVSFTADDVSELFYMIKGRGECSTRRKLLKALKKLSPATANQLP